MRNILCLILLLLISIYTEAQTPQLVKDIFTDPINIGSNPNSFIEVNGSVFFEASMHEQSGSELWLTDGTESGTELIRDIYPGPEISSVFSQVVLNNIMYFTAFDGQFNGNFWRTDGTAQGTYMVKPISSYEHTVFNNKLFFGSSDDPHGTELWESDGTESGTQLFKDLRTGSSSSAPGDFTVAGSKLFFLAYLDSTGQELWVSDGTAAGTQLVKNIYPGSTSSFIEQMTAVGNLLFFIADDSTHGEELWVSDGTTAGTKMAKDIRAGSSSPGINYLTEFNGDLYFRANHGFTARLWKSDGTGPGTVLVDSTNANAPAYLYNANDQFLLFQAQDTLGRELWRSDGTASGTYEVKDIKAAGSSSPDHFTFVNGTVFFTAEDDMHGNELWKTDGTANGTVMVKDIRPGTESSLPDELAAFGNKLIFDGYDGMHGGEPWISDGTEAGTILLRNIGSDVLSNDLWGMIDVNGNLFFTAEDSNVTSGSYNQRSLYKTDGTQAGTERLMIIGANPTFRRSEMELIGNNVVFTGAFDGISLELGISDGTPAGTGVLKDLRPGSLTSFPRNLTAWNNKVYLSAYNGNLNGLWETDGTETGTVMIKDSLTVDYAQFNGNTRIVPALGQLYMSAYEGNSNNNELWTSDGTDAGTRLVKDINLNGSSIPNHITEFNGHIYFSARDSSGTHGLWKSDGTEAGTQLLKEINPDPDRYVFAALGPFTVVQNELFFPADDNINGWELWKTDGTANGTVMVKDINPGELSSGPHDLVELDGKLIFSAYTPTAGQELWISDGTSAGTQLLKDISPGNVSGMYHRPDIYTKYGPNWEGTTIIKVGGYVYFTANNGVSNFELWRTDGTANGTVKYTEIIPGSEGSHPHDYVLSGGILYFTAFHPQYGRELWQVDLITGISETPQKAPTILVYPNPAQQILLVRGNQQGTGQVFNAAGQIMTDFQLNGATVQIEVGNWSPGIYIIQIDGGTAKFVKQ